MPVPPAGRPRATRPLQGFRSSVMQRLSKGSSSRVAAVDESRIAGNHGQDSRAGQPLRPHPPPVSRVSARSSTAGAVRKLQSTLSRLRLGAIKGVAPTKGPVQPRATTAPVGRSRGVNRQRKSRATSAARQRPAVSPVPESFSSLESDEQQPPDRKKHEQTSKNPLKTKTAEMPP